MKRLAIFAILCALPSVSFGAGPATKPAGPPKADANNSVLENKTYHFDLLVPKVWTVQQSSDKATLYKLPGPAGEGAGGLFVVQVGKPLDPKAGLMDAVDGKKKSLTEKNAKVKFTKDAEMKLGGQPAWLLQYDLPTAAKEISTVNGKQGVAKDVVVVQRCREVMCLKDGAVIDLMYLCEESSFDMRTKLVDKVIGSLVWTDDAK